MTFLKEVNTVLLTLEINWSVLALLGMFLNCCKSVRKDREGQTTLAYSIKQCTDGAFRINNKSVQRFQTDTSEQKCWPSQYCCTTYLSKYC